MFKRFSTNYLVMLLVADLFLIFSSLWFGTRFWNVASWGGGEALPPAITTMPEVILLYVAVGIIWMLTLQLNQMYIPQKILFWHDEYQRLFVSHTFASLCFIGILYLANIAVPRSAYLVFYLTSLALMFGYRTVLRYFHRNEKRVGHLVNRVLVAGSGITSKNFIESLSERYWPDHQIMGYLQSSLEPLDQPNLKLPVLGTIEEVAQVVKEHQIDTIVVALPRDSHKALATLMKRVRHLPVRISLIPDYFDLAFYRASLDRIGCVTLFGLRDPMPGGFQLVTKRLVDIVVSAALLLLTSPIMVAIALAIWLEDGGSIFYKAERVGQNGNRFKMVKFRSMHINADKMQHLVNRVDENGNLIHKSEGDPRVTKIGRFIRRTSLDEIPQLFNVLCGDMSLVGPRPELPWLVAEYEDWQYRRLDMPQGITGWWQVNGRSDKPMHLSTELDLYYIQHYSLWLDLQILWRTVGVVLRGRGAY
ncbi:MAG: sugar transferase [Chloroflexota bacterium]